MSEAIQTKEGSLILDGHKLGWHMDRVNAWADGQKIAPISVDMALSRACQASCKFCYAFLQEPQERPNISIKNSLELLDDFAEIGVKAVALVSDGESTLSKAYIPFIQHAAKLGINIGNATNAWALTPEKMDQVLPTMSWIRFTVAAGTPKAFLDIMHHTQDIKIFDTAMKHIKYAVDLKKRLNLKVTLGIQMVLQPQWAAEIIPFAQLGLDLGIDYAIIKHCATDEQNTLDVDYSGYDALHPLLKQAEAMSTEQTKIVIKWDKIMQNGKVPYQRFYGPRFLLQLSGSGLVSASGQFFNARYSKFHMGNITDERFIDIYNSPRYDRVMDYLSSPAFDAQTMMGTLPVQYYASVALDRHAKGIELIIPETGTPPAHVNFV